MIQEIQKILDEWFTEADSNIDDADRTNYLILCEHFNETDDKRTFKKKHFKKLKKKLKKEIQKATE